MLVLCIVTPCGLVTRYQHVREKKTVSIFRTKIMFLRNIGIYLQVHAALLSRKPTSTSSVHDHSNFVKTKFRIMAMKVESSGSYSIKYEDGCLLACSTA
jgi:hypothetical protein